MIISRRAGRLAVPAAVVLLAVALLVDAVVAVFAMPGTVHLPSWDGYSSASARTDIYPTVKVLIGFAAALLGLAVPVARSSRLARAGVLAVISCWVLWLIADWTSPWAAQGRWSRDSSGQVDWTRAIAEVHRWYPPISHLLFGLELAAAIAAVVLLATRLERRAPLTEPVPSAAAR